MVSIPSSRYEVWASSVQNSSSNELVKDFDQFLAEAKVKGEVVGGGKSRAALAGVIACSFPTMPAWPSIQNTLILPVMVCGSRRRVFQAIAYSVNWENLPCEEQTGTLFNLLAMSWLSNRT